MGSSAANSLAVAGPTLKASKIVLRLGSDTACRTASTTYSYHFRYVTVKVHSNVGQGTKTRLTESPTLLCLRESTLLLVALWQVARKWIRTGRSCGQPRLTLEVIHFRS